MRVTLADADLVISARLVPVIVMVWVELIALGAVYRPLAEIEPTFGLMVHATEGSLPVIVALNCSVCPSSSEPVGGATLIEIGIEKSTGPNIFPTVAPMKL